MELTNRRDLVSDEISDEISDGSYRGREVGKGGRYDRVRWGSSLHSKNDPQHI